MGAVLIVDDEDPVRRLLEKWLVAAGHAVVTAGGARDALARLDAGGVAVAVVDLTMEGPDGFWLAQQIRTCHPQIAVIIATASTAIDAARRGMRLGVLDYLTKPIAKMELTMAVARACEWHQAAVAERTARDGLYTRAQARQQELARVEAARRADADAAVEALLRVLRLHDEAAHDHALRVAALATRLASALAVPPSELELLERAALLHDIGKIGVGRAVLAQARALTDDERTLVRHHVELGHGALEVGFLAEVARIVRASHEAWDGSGYPNGLSGEAIPRAARIIAVADAWDALTHDRAYRHGVGAAAARAELDRCAGTQFDPAVVGALASLDLVRSSPLSAA